jgi:hypothetical protein
MSADDPYHDRKVYHKAALIGADGSISPLCAKKPRALNLRLELWTLRWEAVTCRKCLSLRDPLTPRAAPPPAAPPRLLPLPPGSSR